MIKPLFIAEICTKLNMGAMTIKLRTVFNLHQLGCFATFCVVCWIFFKITFFKKFFQEYLRVSNILDQDQARSFVGPDLVPTCLQRLSADDISRQRVNIDVLYFHLSSGKNAPYTTTGLQIRVPF